MSNVTLGLDINTDDKRALKIMGNALLELAGESITQEPVADRSGPAPVAEAAADRSGPAPVAEAAAPPPPAPVTEAAAPPPPGPADVGNSATTPAAPDPVNTGVESPTASTAPVDADGHPWDKRIHSSSKEQNADGRWKARRKPKDYDKGQWESFVQTVKDELSGKQPDAAEVFSASSNDTPPPPAPVTEAAAPPPPAPAPAPVTEAAAPADVTFQDLMKLITTNGSKINNDKVTEICKRHGVDRFVDLNAAHPEKIPAVYESVKGVING